MKEVCSSFFFLFVAESCVSWAEPVTWTCRLEVIQRRAFETDSGKSFSLSHPQPPLWLKCSPCHHFPFPSLLSTCFTSFFYILGTKRQPLRVCPFRGVRLKVITAAKIFWTTRRSSKLFRSLILCKRVEHCVKTLSFFSNSLMLPLALQLIISDQTSH